MGQKCNVCKVKTKQHTQKEEQPVSESTSQQKPNHKISKEKTDPINQNQLLREGPNRSSIIDMEDELEPVDAVPLYEEIKQQQQQNSTISKNRNRESVQRLSSIMGMKPSIMTIPEEQYNSRISNYSSKIAFEFYIPEHRAQIEGVPIVDYASMMKI